MPLLSKNKAWGSINLPCFVLQEQPNEKRTADGISSTSLNDSKEQVKKILRIIESK